MSEDTLLEFPCEFPVKMMGRDTPQFRQATRDIIENHAGPVADDSIKTNMSGKGNFVSVTITITARSQKQLDSIYEDVSARDDVLMAL